MSPAVVQAVMAFLIVAVPGFSFLVWWLFHKRLKEINKHLKQPGAWRKEHDSDAL